MSYATDALQWTGIAARDGSPPAGLVGGLPGRRLQHEHALIAVQDAAADAAAGRVGDARLLRPRRRRPSGGQRRRRPGDGRRDAGIARGDSRPGRRRRPRAPHAGRRPPPRCSRPRRGCRRWISTADEIAARSATSAATPSTTRGGPAVVLPRRRAPRRAARQGTAGAAPARPHPAQRPPRDARRDVADVDGLDGRRLPFAADAGPCRHQPAAVDERTATSASSASHGQRVFVDGGDGWRQLGAAVGFRDATRPLPLDLPPRRRRLHGDAAAPSTTPHAMTLAVDVLAGDAAEAAGQPPCRAGRRRRQRAGRRVLVGRRRRRAHRRAAGQRTGGGVSRTAASRIAADAGSRFDRVGGDEMLHAGRRRSANPSSCIEAIAAPRFSAAHRRVGSSPTRRSKPQRRCLRSTCCRLATTSMAATGIGTGTGDVSDTDTDTDAGTDSDTASPRRRRRRPEPAPATPPATSRASARCCPGCATTRSSHYLSPRGLEQYSGGGWGTRDVCQGPLEMLLALRPHARRCATCCCASSPRRTTTATGRSGSCSSTATATIRAGDSHGDIVLWPLLALAQYLRASGDAALLDAAPSSTTAARRRRVWQHVAARTGADRRARASPAPGWPPTATATGTTRCSRPTRCCANACAARGP